MHQTIRAATPDEVPVLDLGPLNTGGDLKPIAKELRHACETIGFFYVANHGIPTATFDGVFDATRRYFDLPEAQRLTAPDGRALPPRVHATRHQSASGLRARSQGKLRDRDRACRSPIPM